MTVREKEYQKMVEKASPDSEMTKSLLKSFWVGGLICCVGQALSIFASEVLGFVQDEASGFTAFVLIFLGALLTGLGVYDKIGQYAGAGSIVPITGFANSIVAPAMEFKREGYVMGVGAKLFTLAGPVLVFGVSISVVIGILYAIFGG